MKGEMHDYVVSVVCTLDDDDSCHFIHFVTEYPVNSVGFWEDFYDVVFNIFDSDVSSYLRIVEIEEGF